MKGLKEILNLLTIVSAVHGDVVDGDILKDMATNIANNYISKDEVLKLVDENKGKFVTDKSAEAFKEEIKEKK